MQGEDDAISSGSRNSSKASRSSSYVGVRMRDWGNWVSEIREPRKKSRIWLGAFATAEMAPKAHDVAAISIKGKSAIVNFPEFAELLPRHATCSPRDVQVAALKAAHMDHLKQEMSEETTTSSSPPSPQELSEMVELPMLSYESVDSAQEEFRFLESDGWEYRHQWLHSSGDCQYFGGDNMNMGLEAALSCTFDSLLWQH